MQAGLLLLAVLSDYIIFLISFGSIAGLLWLPFSKRRARGRISAALGVVIYILNTLMSIYTASNAVKHLPLVDGTEAFILLIFWLYCLIILVLWFALLFLFKKPTTIDNKDDLK
jgi:hypothetical protein